METRPKVSVIIPIFNVEPFIAGCARNLFEQTIDEIEYIFVDDNSPDDSVAILRDVIREYPEREKQVKVLRTEANSGVEGADSLGQSAARGEYLIRSDSDDYVDRDIYRTLYDKAVETGSDIVMCDKFEFEDENEKPLCTKAFGRSCSYRSRKEETVWNILLWSGAMSLCTSLIRRTLYGNVRYQPKGDYAGDLLLMLQMVCSANDVAYVDRPLYYYRHRRTSSSRDFNERSILTRWADSNENVRMMERFLEEKSLLRHYASGLDFSKSFSRNTLVPLLNSGKYIDMFFNSFPEINWRILANPHVPFNDKKMILSKAVLRFFYE